MSLLKQVLEIHDLLDSARVNGQTVVDFLQARGLVEVTTETIDGEKGSTDFIRIRVPGLDAGAPALGIVGRLGGIGARPERIGLVSDAEGAIAALACGLKLADMQARGDCLKGDVLIATHICPHAPTEPHEPVPFMGSPVDMATMNRYEVSAEMAAILSIDTTRGNRVINHRGFALSPTVKEGYILKISDDLLDIMERVTGALPVVLPITTQDITPYGNGLYHLNSIMQPAVATASPVVGVAITAEVPVPGCGTGANQEVDIELAARFCLEVAKEFGEGRARFYDEDEFARMVELYGSMKVLQTFGRGSGEN
jgi:hypothetical protein